MKLGSLFPNFKSWSNFRLMLVLGTTATLLSLAVGAVVVQAALSSGSDEGTPTAEETEAATPDPEAQAEEALPGDENPAQPAGTAGGRPANRPDSGADFNVTCPVIETTSTTNTCQVESYRGFSGRVELSCAELPRNLSCSFTPDSVVPRTNGSSTFRLELNAGNIPPGSYDFEIVGRSGGKVRTHRYPWGVRPPAVAVESPPPGRPVAPVTPTPTPTPAAPEPTFAFTCGSLSEGGKVPWSLSKDGPLVKINCFLTPLNGFDEPVEFKFAQPNGLAKPDTVNFILDQLEAKKLFDLSFELGDVVRALTPEQLEQGVDYPFEVTGTSESGKSLTRQVILTVTE